MPSRYSDDLFEEVRWMPPTSCDVGDICVSYFGEKGLVTEVAYTHIEVNAGHLGILKLKVEDYFRNWLVRV